MNEKQKEQAEYWLEKFVELSNHFFDEGDEVNRQYWNGQVKGICKVLELIKSEIDTKHYLNKMV